MTYLTKQMLYHMTIAYGRGNQTRGIKSKARPPQALSLELYKISMSVFNFSIQKQK